MRIFRSVLAAVIALSLAAGGYGSIQTKKTVSAAAADKEMTVKAASDFTLKLPSAWKDNYVMKSSNGRKHGSYVAFSAEKCYRQTKGGWLFTIMRYKDDSYTDMPSFKLVGKWNGYHYVALFPTDVQTEGATKAAKKQYSRLNAGAEEAADSIQPVKSERKGKDVCRGFDFSLELPDSWKNNYIMKKTGDTKKDAAFYAKKCYKQTGEGWLFSIIRCEDESYQELPDYELVGKWNGMNYVAVFPTDVQFEGATKAAVKQYQKLSESVKKAVRSIAP